MKIPIWRCSYCGDPHCIILKVEDDGPDICPYSGGMGVFVPDEITEIELEEYINGYSSFEGGRDGNRK